MLQSTTKRYKAVQNSIETLIISDNDLYQFGDIPAQEIFSTLSKWFVFIDTINEDMMLFLRQTVKYTNKSFNSYFVVEELERLVETNAKFVGELYLEMLKNEHYPDYKQEKIQNTIFKLRENGESKNALKIANMYRAKGYYWIKGIDS